MRSIDPMLRAAHDTWWSCGNMAGKSPMEVDSWKFICSKGTCPASRIWWVIHRDSWNGIAMTPAKLALALASGINTADQSWCSIPLNHFKRHRFSMAPWRIRPGSIKGATQLRSSHDGDIEDLGCDASKYQQTMVPGKKSWRVQF